MSIYISNGTRENSTEKQELSELEYLQKIEEAIFDLQSDNIQEIALTIMKYYQPNIQISFNHIICYLTYSYFIANSKNDDICIRFLQAIESQERSIKENQSNILKIFAQILLDSCSDESNYLLEKLLENKIIDEKFVIGKQTYYFGHLRTIEENQKIQQDSKFTGSFLSKFDEYSKENFETHKRLISEGVNPNELSKVLRNDDIEALQGITSQQDFNYDQLIESSMYERCSYVNEIYGPKRKTLVNFAAYFGSINCFKYLLMNNAKVSDTGNYAVAGGNHEIIHLCEQNHSSFDNALIVAIEFHRNDVFKYFYENKTKFRPNTKDLIDECLLNDNYEILGFLLDEGYILVNDVCINIMAKKGNLFIIKYLKIFPKGILASTYMNNMELVNYLLNENSVDINSETIFCVCFKLIF